MKKFNVEVITRTESASSVLLFRGEAEASDWARSHIDGNQAFGMKDHKSGMCVIFNPIHVIRISLERLDS